MKLKTSTKTFERAVATVAARKVLLRLYVAGSSDRSIAAIRNAKEICDEYLTGAYELDVIDIIEQPRLAKDDHILAIPTLVKRQPPPLRRFIGDLSNRDVVLAGLDLKRK